MPRARGGSGVIPHEPAPGLRYGAAMTETPTPAETAAPATPEAAVDDPRAALIAGLTRRDTRLHVLVLQHPQEQDVQLGTARLLTGQLNNATHKVGLSWANLGKALGRPQVDPKRWAVLHMGAKEDVAKVPRGELAVFGKSGPDPAGDLVLADLEGVVLLDGTWSQAKTLWWRNPWLLKLRRIVLHPDFRSAYGSVRKEPRRESVSTLEAGAFLLGKLEGDPGLQAALLKPFDTLLKQWKSRRGPRRGPGPAAPAPGAGEEETEA